MFKVDMPEHPPMWATSMPVDERVKELEAEVERLKARNTSCAFCPVEGINNSLKHEVNRLKEALKTKEADMAGL